MSNPAPGSGREVGEDAVSVTRTESVVRRGRRGLGGWWWPALLLVPLLLAALTALITHRSVEDDLTTRTQAALSAAGITGARATFSGRDGTVTLPAGADAAAARAAAEKVDGVRVVTISGSGSGTASGSGSEATPSGTATGVGDFAISTGADGTSVTVQAIVADQAARQALLDAVTAANPGATVIDQITVTAGAAGLPADAVTGLLAAIGSTPGVSISGSGSTITLTGAVVDEATKQKVADTAQALNPSATIDNRLTVDPNAAGATPSGEPSTEPSPAATSEAGSGSTVSSACATVNTEVAARLKANPVRFATGSATILAQSVAELKAIAGTLKDCLGAEGGASGLAVEGHTDNTGGTALNKTLSQQRADAVKAALVSAGLPADKITATGFGSSKPVASNATDAGRAANRRVEIRLT